MTLRNLRCKHACGAKKGQTSISMAEKAREGCEQGSPGAGSGAIGTERSTIKRDVDGGACGWGREGVGGGVEDGCVWEGMEGWGHEVWRGWCVWGGTVGGVEGVCMKPCEVHGNHVTWMGVVWMGGGRGGGG
jgi:hypothetical protein